jgi:putative peptide zinc metalloprotease protein
VACFAARLLEAGLIYDRRLSPSRPRPVRTWRDWVQWKLPLWDPTPLLGFLAPLLRWTSRVPFLVLGWLPLLSVATFLTFRSWGEVSYEMSRLFGLHEPYALVWLYGLLFVILWVHEFGHATVCYALGAPVRQIGVMLYLGMPFGYCDVSAAHLLPRKRDRIAVSLGGLYYQMGFGALAVLAWAWLPLAEPARAIALKLAIVAGTSIVFDLNPFAKLDGYYVLADWLGIPNLRDRSFSYLRARMKGERGEPLAPAERRLFLGYAVLGSVATAALMAMGLIWWHRILSAALPR